MDFLKRNFAKDLRDVLGPGGGALVKILVGMLVSFSWV